MDAKLEWANSTHVSEIRLIDISGSPDPWSVSKISRAMRTVNIAGMVAVAEPGGVLGFAIWKFKPHPQSIHMDTYLKYPVADWNVQRLLLKLVVHPHARGLGIGSLLLDRVKENASVTIRVRETDLALQKFLSASGFKAKRVLRSYFGDTEEDAYLMRFTNRFAKKAGV